MSIHSQIRWPKSGESFKTFCTSNHFLAKKCPKNVHPLGRTISAVIPSDYTRVTSLGYTGLPTNLSKARFYRSAHQQILLISDVRERCRNVSLTYNFLLIRLRVHIQLPNSKCILYCSFHRLWLYGAYVHEWPTQISSPLFRVLRQKRDTRSLTCEVPFGDTGI